MNIELINTGSELLLGRRLNTHQQWICRRLADLGFTVTRQVAIADNGRDIQEAVRDALGRADLIITTGGLGPTADDLTRELIAELLGRELHEDPAVLKDIERFFAARKRSMPARTGRQAMVPAGALVLRNAHGTAPGLAIELNPNSFRPAGGSTWLIMLPGPPRELHPMFGEQVLPLIRKQYPRDESFICRTLRTTGLGESMVEERITKPLEHLLADGLELGYCAHVGEVDVRFGARGLGGEGKVREAEKIVCDLIGNYIFGADDDELEAVVVHELTARRKTLALAESCTGGYLGHRITNVPGASAVLLAGLVTYSNAAKQTVLGVKPDTLAAHGAVSEATARAMAEGARWVTEADFAIAVTGIAGPGGGTDEKPVGTVFIALAGPDGTRVAHAVNAYDRETFKHVTSQQALELLRRRLAAA